MSSDGVDALTSVAVRDRFNVPTVHRLRCIPVKKSWLRTLRHSIPVLLGSVGAVQAFDLNNDAARLLVSIGQDVLDRPLSLVADGKIKVADRFLEVKIHTEPSTKVDDLWFAGIRVDVYVDGEFVPELTAGSLGGGDDTASEAQATAISDWVNLTGVAVLRALARVHGHDDILRGWTAYTGHTGFRGQQPSDWDQHAYDIHVLLLKSLERYLQTENRYAFFLQLRVNGSAVTSGEVRANARVSEEALRSLESITYPEGDYLLKKFYVLERTQHD